MTQPLAFIVEDDADLALIFTEALQAAGFTTTTISRGDTAIEQLAEAVPAVVILDLHLPGADGSEVLRSIRADGRLTQTKVILASADAAMADALDLDADLTLLKPISFSQLRDLTKRLI
jgi:DNA-binding response OmpR family regulator